LPIVPRVQASLNDILLRQGRPAEAADAMQRLLAEMGDNVPPTIAILALDVAYRACEAADRHAEALEHFKAAERVRRKMMTGQMRAQSELFVTRTEADQARLRAAHAQEVAAHERERAALFAADAERDPLTGLGNRRHLEHQAAELLPALQQAGRPLVLAQIDVDHFKQVNDRHGHAAGDAVLVALAEILRENTRAGDVLVRHGGEEFVVVLPGAPLARAVDVFERLRERVEAHRCLLPDGTSLAVTVSIGVAAAPPYALDALLQQADESLYAAKRGGRNQLRLAPTAGPGPGG
jgi:diguanylate cyclase (GGDEF)-like protein